MTADHKVVFVPSGLKGTVPEGTTVLEAARQLWVDLDTVCGGRGICGRCQVEPTFGTFAKWAMTGEPGHRSAWGALEKNYKGRRPITEGRRLGCSAQICGEVVIDVPPESQIHRQVIRKAGDIGDLEIDPIYTLRYLPEGDTLTLL